VSGQTVARRVHLGVVACVVPAVALGACGSKGESPAVKHARAVLHRTFGGTEACSDKGGGVATCRVVSLAQEPPLLQCSVSRARQYRCDGVDRASPAELAFLRRHAPRARYVIHVSSVGRLTVPRRVVAPGIGMASAPFRFPRAFGERSRLHGHGPSIYLTINRDHYEDDLVTDTGNAGRQRVYGPSGTLLSDYAYTPHSEDAWDAITRVRARQRDNVPDYFTGPADPLGVFEQLRDEGRLHRMDAHTYAEEKSTWAVDGRGIPVRFQTRNGEARIDVRFLKLEILPLNSEMRRQLRIGKHPHSRVVHTVL
jgi:hypothetical protein